MQMNPYFSFKGDCEEAFALYERCLGARRGPIFRYAGTPLATTVPADWAHKVMHGSVTIGDQVLMGGDLAPEHYEKPAGVSLSLHVQDFAEAERLFGGLVEGGRVLVPLEKTFWSPGFGVLEDRFGVRWMINCEGAEEPAAER